MQIGELVRQAGTTPKAVRFYESAGLLPAPLRTPKWDLAGVVASLVLAIGGLALGGWGMRRGDVSR